MKRMHIKYYTAQNAAPHQPDHGYFMYIIYVLIKNGCYPIPTAARIAAIKLSVKTEVKKSP